MQRTNPSFSRNITPIIVFKWHCLFHYWHETKVHLICINLLSDQLYDSSVFRTWTVNLSPLLVSSLKSILFLL